MKLEMPITKPWTVSLIAAWGFGSTFDTKIRFRLPDGTTFRDRSAEGEAWFYTYQVGISSRLEQHLYRWQLSLGLPVLGNPRLGVSYRVGNDLAAVRLNFGFPF